MKKLKYIGEETENLTRFKVYDLYATTKIFAIRLDNGEMEIVNINDSKNWEIIDDTRTNVLKREEIKMINVWILTVVIGTEYGMTSFQEKYYSESDALNASKHHNKNLKGTPYLIVAVSQTQEQKYEH
jgi:hypothetical protein